MGSEAQLQRWIDLLTSGDPGHINQGLEEFLYSRSRELARKYLELSPTCTEILAPWVDLKPENNSQEYNYLIPALILRIISYNSDKVSTILALYDIILKDYSWTINGILRMKRATFQEEKIIGAIYELLTSMVAVSPTFAVEVIEKFRIELVNPGEPDDYFPTPIRTSVIFLCFEILKHGDNQLTLRILNAIFSRLMFKIQFQTSLLGHQLMVAALKIMEDPAIPSKNKRMFVQKNIVNIGLYSSDRADDDCRRLLKKMIRDDDYGLANDTSMPREARNASLAAALVGMPLVDDSSRDFLVQVLEASPEVVGAYFTKKVELNQMEWQIRKTTDRKVRASFAYDILSYTRIMQIRLLPEDIDFTMDKNSIARLVFPVRLFERMFNLSFALVRESSASTMMMQNFLSAVMNRLSRCYQSLRILLIRHKGISEETIKSGEHQREFTRLKKKFASISAGYITDGVVRYLSNVITLPAEFSVVLAAAAAKNLKLITAFDDQRKISVVRKVKLTNTKFIHPNFLAAPLFAQYELLSSFFIFKMEYLPDILNLKIKISYTHPLYDHVIDLCKKTILLNWQQFPPSEIELECWIDSIRTEDDIKIFDQWVNYANNLSNIYDKMLEVENTTLEAYHDIPNNILLNGGITEMNVQNGMSRLLYVALNHFEYNKEYLSQPLKTQAAMYLSMVTHSLCLMSPIPTQIHLALSAYPVTDTIFPLAAVKAHLYRLLFSHVDPTDTYGVFSRDMRSYVTEVSTYNKPELSGVYYLLAPLRDTGIFSSPTPPGSLPFGLMLNHFMEDQQTKTSMWSNLLDENIKFHRGRNRAVSMTESLLNTISQCYYMAVIGRRNVSISKMNFLSVLLDGTISHHIQALRSPTDRDAVVNQLLSSELLLAFFKNAHEEQPSEFISECCKIFFKFTVRIFSAAISLNPGCLVRLERHFIPFIDVALNAKNLTSLMADSLLNIVMKHGSKELVKRYAESLFQMITDQEIELNEKYLQLIIDMLAVKPAISQKILLALLTILSNEQKRDWPMWHDFEERVVDIFDEMTLESPWLLVSDRMVNRLLINLFKENHPTDSPLFKRHHIVRLIVHLIHQSPAIRYQVTALVDQMMEPVVREMKGDVTPTGIYHSVPILYAVLKTNTLHATWMSKALCSFYIRIILEQIILSDHDTPFPAQDGLDLLERLWAILPKTEGLAEVITEDRETLSPTCTRLLDIYCTSEEDMDAYTEWIVMNFHTQDDESRKLLTKSIEKMNVKMKRGDLLALFVDRNASKITSDLVYNDLICQLVGKAEKSAIEKCGQRIIQKIVETDALETLYQYKQKDARVIHFTASYRLILQTSQLMHKMISNMSPKSLPRETFFVLLKLYTATTLPHDRLLLKCIQAYEVVGLTIRDNQYQWGPKINTEAPDVIEKNPKRGRPNGPTSEMSEDIPMGMRSILRGIQFYRDTMEKTVHSAHTHQIIEAEMIQEKTTVETAQGREESCGRFFIVYDATFILPIFETMLVENDVNPYDFYNMQGLALSISCMSNSDVSIRKLAYSILSSFLSASYECGRYRMKEEIEFTLNLLKNSISTLNMRIAGIHTRTLVTALSLFSDPREVHYRPFVELLKKFYYLPLYSASVLSNILSHTGDITTEQSKSLERSAFQILESLTDWEDVESLKLNTKIFHHLMEYYNFTDDSQAYKNMYRNQRGKILNILTKCSQDPALSYSLFKADVFSWITAVVDNTDRKRERETWGKILVMALSIIERQEEPVLISSASAFFNAMLPHLDQLDPDESDVELILLPILKGLTLITSNLYSKHFVHPSHLLSVLRCLTLHCPNLENYPSLNMFQKEGKKAELINRLPRGSWHPEDKEKTYKEALIFTQKIIAHNHISLPDQSLWTLYHWAFSCYEDIGNNDVECALLGGFLSNLLKNASMRVEFSEDAQSQLRKLILSRYGAIHSSPYSTVMRETLNSIFLVALIETRKDNLKFYGTHPMLRMYETLMDGSLSVILSSMDHPQQVCDRAMESFPQDYMVGSLGKKKEREQKTKAQKKKRRLQGPNSEPREWTQQCLQMYLEEYWKKLPPTSFLFFIQLGRADNDVDIMRRATEMSRSLDSFVQGKSSNRALKENLYKTNRPHGKYYVVVRKEGG
ncbi:hypothetical protein PROFUN_03352 [Planoprotostelium fungivorum]|uniref:URB1 C-terminal domain-containing protein n=1 Tax=Planoprotostelium fungivorum TaxID=1890364 RepID=A0A2P6NWA8_9EUKA|nr:hypothetical protein PROFUN_03352 [Planoprotostelium fungivorum]